MAIKYFYSSVNLAMLSTLSYHTVGKRHTTDVSTATKQKVLLLRGQTNQFKIFTEKRIPTNIAWKPNVYNMKTRWKFGHPKKTLSSFWAACLHTKQRDGQISANIRALPVIVLISFVYSLGFTSA